jgi:hypothetical protein
VPAASDEKAAEQLGQPSVAAPVEGFNGRKSETEAMDDQADSVESFERKLAKEAGAKDTSAKETLAKGVGTAQPERSAYSFGVAGKPADVSQAIDPSAQEQVLFFFRIVDTPLARAASQAQSGVAEAGERAKASVQAGRASEQDERGARPVPVPAPAAPAGPVK